jgi:hypothetical protein
MRRHAEEEINIFNFSFLDILSCTIGALIFILLMIILSTTDLVEKKLLEDIQGKHASALTELAQLEKLVKKRQEELSVLESQQAKLKKYATRLKKEVSAKDKKIASLEEMLKKPGGFSLGKSAASIVAPRIEAEARKTDRAQKLLYNIEKKSVTSAKGKIYFGESRQPVETKDNRALRDAMKQFLRYHDSMFEKIWWTEGGGGKTSYNKMLEIAGSLKSFYSDGLKAEKEKNPPAFSGAVDGRLAIDTDKDGIDDILYFDSNSDMMWDLKYRNTDRDDFWEEVFIGYDPATGSWGMKLVDTDSDGTYDLLFEDTVPDDNDWEIKLVDPDLKSDKARVRYEDTDNDGVYDTKLINTDFEDDDWEQINSGYDPRFKRWQASSIDIDGDGIPDIMWGDTDMSNDDWEEKFIDQDSDGEWDIRYRDLDLTDNDWEALYSKPNRKKDSWKEVLVDTDGDGAWDKKMVDEDGDGEWEKEIELDSGK